jgi:hypothetical protein
MSVVNTPAVDYLLVKDRLPENTMFLGYRGSQAHGMFVPSSNPESIDDIDLMGVYVAPIEHYFGFGRKEVYESFVDEYDIVSYELRKFLGLLLNNNPNVLSMLWLEPESILVTSPTWEYLVDERYVFASKKAYHSFSGYAYAQLKKMTAFNQREQERVKDMEAELKEMGIAFINGVPQLPPGADKNTIEWVRQYNEVRSKYFSGYMGEKRKNNVIKYGYDTKNAAHLIRLLRMAVEFLTTGEFTVKRPDAEELLEIKQGKWSLAKVQQYSELLFNETTKAFENCSLPEQPDKEKAEKILKEILIMHFFHSPFIIENPLGY